MATYHQSQLKSWQECPARVGYDRAGLPKAQNSFMAYGSVMHHAVEVQDRLVAEAHNRYGTGTKERWQATQEAIETSVQTFLWTWSPANIESVCEPVPSDGWAKGHGFSELRTRGAEALRKYGEVRRFDDVEVLATEYGFNVPIDGTWDDELEEPHRLAGTVDRLVCRRVRNIESVKIEDYKTGASQPQLRFDLQFTSYCYASTKREFWLGAGGEDGFGAERGEELYQRFLEKPRGGTWISLRSFKFEDAGWRGPIDYERFAILVSQIHASITADIFPLSISGLRCPYCEYRHNCAGTGIPPVDHGHPFNRTT